METTINTSHPDHTDVSVADPTGTDVDILIIGAGPIGLMAGIQLWTHGIRNIRIIDQGIPPEPDALTDFSRAIGVHARTMELMEDLGMADELVERGTIAHTGSYYYNTEMMYRMGYALGCDRAHLKYDWTLMVTQGNTIDVLVKKLTGMGQHIEWKSELADFTPHDDYVDATIHHIETDTTETIRARWLLGCDGAHSMTRKGLNINFPGKVYPVRWVVCDLNLEWDIPHTDIAFLGTLDAFAVTLPLKAWGNNRYRITMMQPIEEDDPSMQIGHAIPTDQRKFSRKDCEDFFRKIYPKAQASCPDDAGNWFMVHCRLADSYRQGRCFLLGDAAHIHSPILGQGMNMGLQDATNLAWKLAAVLKGESSPELLETYETERREVAGSVIKMTDFTTKVITLRSPFLQRLRGWVLNTFLHIPSTRRFLISKLIQILITYNEIPTVLTKSDWVNSFWDRFRVPTPKEGDRCPDPVYIDSASNQHRMYENVTGNQFSAMLFTGRKALNDAELSTLTKVSERILHRYGEQVQPVIVCANESMKTKLAASIEGKNITLLDDSNRTVHKAYGAKSTSVFVFRPDRYVGYRGYDPEAIFTYMDRIIHQVDQATDASEPSEQPPSILQPVAV